MNKYPHMRNLQAEQYKKHPDTTEKVERTETGYRMTISSKRGTGTRDQDEVSITGKTETLDKLMEQRQAMRTAVKVEIDQRRMHQPDEGDEE